jgi:hypothetical protein
MMDQLKINYDDAALGEADEMGQISGSYEDDMYRLEERLEDFQETMERVQARFFDKKSEQKKQPAQEEEKKTEDQEMVDESVDDKQEIIFSEEQPTDKKEELINEDQLEQILEKEFIEQDNNIVKAIEREKELQAKISQVGVTAVSEQTKEVMALDLEELIKEQGEDIEFEFYYEGKKINLHQTIYEIIKDSESKRR